MTISIKKHIIIGIARKTNYFNSESMSGKLIERKEQYANF